MNPPGPPWTLAYLAELCGAPHTGDDVLVSALRAWPASDAEALLLVESQEEADSARAVALLCPTSVQTALPCLRCPEARTVFAELCLQLYARIPGIDPASHVSSGAHLGDQVRVEAGAVVEAGARLGDHVVIEACAHVAGGVQLGRGCRIGAGAVVLEGTVLGEGVAIGAAAVVGSRGFGFVYDEGKHQPIPQVGGVHIGSHSTIGAGTCIDRGTIGATQLGERVTVGELTQLAHNLSIGDDVFIGSQVGIAGSCQIDSGCRLGDQVGMAPHSHIGRDSKLAGRSGNTRRKVPPGSDLVGFPARPREGARRSYAAMNRFGWVLELLERLENRDT